MFASQRAMALGRLRLAAWVVAATLAGAALSPAVRAEDCAGADALVSQAAAVADLAGREALLRGAVAVCPGQLSALASLAGVLAEQGRGAEAEVFRQRLATERQRAGGGAAVATAVVGAEAIAQALTAQPAPDGLSRSIVMLTDKPRIDLQIRFAFGSDELLPEALVQLAQVGQALAAEGLRTTRISIEGHTDAVGAPTYNRQLSQRRAERVREVLANRFGIAAGRLSAIGHGPDHPVAPNDSDEGRARNRRVTFVNIGPP